MAAATSGVIFPPFAFPEDFAGFGDAVLVLAFPIHPKMNARIVSAMNTTETEMSVRTHP